MTTKLFFGTLTAAAAMAVPAFSAELIGSWDFSDAEKTTEGTIKSSVAYGDGENDYLYIKAAGSIDSNVLDINPSSDGHTTIDVSNANVTLSEGISIVMTVTDLTVGEAGADRVNIWAAIGTYTYAAAFIGEYGSGEGDLRQAGFAANGDTGNVTITEDGYVDLSSYPITLTLTFVGAVLSLYEDGVLIAQATIDADVYKLIEGSTGEIYEVAIGSWDVENNNDNTFSDFKISSLEIYRGDVMATPEPSMFGMMFGLGAIGLVATRRRRR